MTQTQHQARTWKAVALSAICTASFALWGTQPARGLACVGDCDGNGTVSVNELIMMVNIALGSIPMSACPVADQNGDGQISVDELVMATRAALEGCVPAASPTATPAPPTPTPTGGAQTGCNAAPFTSTFEAIQTLIFQKHGCTTDVCHGSVGKQGGLVLVPDVAYQNIYDVKSTESDLNLVQPGDKDRSYLWLKLAAATDPTQLPPGFQISGVPMPAVGTALSANELEALRLWIYSGAPQTGTVNGTANLLDACLPTPEPILIQPLDPPAPGTGVQFRMPPWHLEAHSEHELCFATYYDISDQVPPEYQDPTGTMFRFNVQDLRQDPSSHHLILNRYVGPVTDIHDPSIGAWTCNGGPNAGQTCEPTDTTSCGADGICTSQIKQSFACIGFGPNAPPQDTGGGFAQNFYAIGGAQSAQAHNQYLDGVFAQIPMKGILYWNSHAFNLTDQDTTMHAWLNYSFAPADNQIYPLQSIFDISKIFSANAAPYTTQTLCNDHVLPQGAALFNLTSHTHHHGQHFSISIPDDSAPDGQKSVYDSYIYNDPANINYNPPYVFNKSDPATRTLHYCSFYNNGLNLKDNSLDPNLVTRSSLIPTSAANTIGRCKPTACAAGKIGAACNGKTDNATCDSTPGAGDGLCDACAITGGESTQNEMFILIGSYYLTGDAVTSGAAQALDASGNLRSTYSDLALPPQIGCSSSHAGHAGHNMQ